MWPMQGGWNVCQRLASLLALRQWRMNVRKRNAAILSGANDALAVSQRHIENDGSAGPSFNGGEGQFFSSTGARILILDVVFPELQPCCMVAVMGAAFHFDGTIFYAGVGDQNHQSQ